MKIHPVYEAVRSLNQVHEKKDGGGHARGQNHGQEHPSADPPFEEVLEATVDKVDGAVEAFASDSDAHAIGLNAARVGVGPGLKVVLKDGTGAVIRQFTGEEFLRLREAASRDGRSRGKILDQKS